MTAQPATTGSVTYSLADGIAHIRLDDGKVNAMSTALIGDISSALDRAEADAAIAVISGRPGIFSAGFHMKEMMSSPENLHTIMNAGARLCLRVLAFPHPVVTACTGHAYPMGAFIMLSADYRLGAEGPFRIGLNEVAIGIAVPQFALELASHRLAPAHFYRTALTGEMYGPAEALTAGFLDELAPEAALEETALARASALKAIDLASHRTTKARARKPVIAAMTRAIENELTIEAARKVFGL